MGRKNIVCFLLCRWRRVLTFYLFSEMGAQNLGLFSFFVGGAPIGLISLFRGGGGRKNIVFFSSLQVGATFGSVSLFRVGGAKSRILSSF